MIYLTSINLPPIVLAALLFLREIHLVKSIKHAMSAQISAADKDYEVHLTPGSPAAYVSGPPIGRMPQQAGQRTNKLLGLNYWH